MNEITFISVWGNTFTTNENGERPDNISDIEWSQYLTDLQMLQSDTTEAMDVIFERNMKIIDKQKSIAISDKVNNQNVLDDQKKIQITEALKKVAEAQIQNPEATYLIGSESALLKMAEIAKEAGITIPLNAEKIEPTGIVTAGWVIDPAKSVNENEINTQKKSFNFYVWLYDIFNQKSSYDANSNTKTGSETATKTATETATKTATKTATSTEAYTQGNITVTGGAGAGATNVTIQGQKEKPTSKNGTSKVGTLK